MSGPEKNGINERSSGGCYPSLHLYYFAACPYCQDVLEVISELSLKVSYFDTRLHPEYRNKLLADTGRSTVPCLYIDGRPMHESQDIIFWLKDNVQNLEKV